MYKQSFLTRISLCVFFSGFGIIFVGILAKEKMLLLAPNMLAPIGLLLAIIGFFKIKSKTGILLVFLHFMLLFWVFAYPMLLKNFF